MDRLTQKSELLIKLGMLFGPLLRLADKPEEYDGQERAQTIARYCAEWQSLANEFATFANGQPGHAYAVEQSKFHYALNFIVASLTHTKNLNFTELIWSQFAAAQAAIDAIPIPKNSEILAAGTPFSSYCKLKALCEVEATTKVVWIDAYVADNIFHQLLAGIRPNAHIALVTCKPKPNASHGEMARWNAFLDVSRLFALERSPSAYSLIVHNYGLLHDRWVTFDDKRIYGLGGSSKDAGNRHYFTISLVEATAENIAKIQDHVVNGTEYFGTNIPVHL